jgi:hypothetical protein
VSSWFHCKKFITTHGHMNVRLLWNVHFTFRLGHVIYSLLNMTSALFRLDGFYGDRLVSDRTRTQNVRLQNTYQKHEHLNNSFSKRYKNISRNLIYFEAEQHKRNNYKYSAVPSSSNSLIL